MGRRPNKNNVWKIEDFSNDIIENRNTIIEELVKTNFVPNYIRQQWSFESSEDYFDSVQYIYQFLLEIRPDRIIHLYKYNKIDGIRRFVAGMIIRNLKSENSPLYYKLFKNKKQTVSINDVNNI